MDISTQGKLSYINCTAFTAVFDTVNPAGWIPSSVSSNLCLFMEKQCLKPNTQLSDHTLPVVWMWPGVNECAQVGGVSRGSSKGSSGHEHTIMRPPIPCSLDWGCNEYLKTDVWQQWADKKQRAWSWGSWISIGSSWGIWSSWDLFWLAKAIWV